MAETAKKTAAKKTPAKKAAAKPDASAEGAAPSSASVSDVEEDAPAEKPAKKQPPVQVPTGSRSSSGFSKRTRELQVMLADLGFYHGRIDGFYTTAVRNAVSELQQALPGYRGRPHGAFDASTRDALIASDIPTTS